MATPFHQAKKAAGADDPANLMLCLEKLQPGDRDPKSGRSLIWACFTTKKCNSLAAVVLVRWGCSIDDRDRTDQTLLHYAAESNYHETVAEILKFSPNPNSQDYGGYTPLYYGVWNCNPEIVKMLLDAGGDPKIKNKWGKNSWYPLVTKNLSQFADMTNMQEVWDLLKPHLDAETKSDLDKIWREESF